MARHAGGVREASARGGEGLQREDVAHLHAVARVLEHERDALVAVDEALHHVMPRQVADRHDYGLLRSATATRVGAAVDRHLVRVDHFLDHAAQLAQIRVHARMLDARVGGVARRSNQRLELRVEGEGEGTVNDVPYDSRPPANRTVYLRAKVQLHHVAIVEATHVVRVWCVMCSDMINGASRRKAHSSLRDRREESPTFGPFSPISERTLSSKSQQRSQKRISGLILFWM